MLSIEEIVYDYSRCLYTTDPLFKACYQAKLEDVLKYIKGINYVDKRSYYDLKELGIDLVYILIRYKKIRKIEAQMLIALKYVTFENVISLFLWDMKNIE